MRALLVVAAVVLAVPTVAQADCAADAERLASRYGASTELPRGGAGGTPDEAPATSDSRRVRPEAMSRSGGVIAPPEETRGRVIQPPPGVTPSMPTAPQIRPEPQAGETQKGAAKSAQVESLLTAARAAARRGDEAECEQRLEEARAIGGDPG